MKFSALFCLVLSGLLASACNNPDPNVLGHVDDPSMQPPDTSQSDPENPSLPDRTYDVDVLLFNGTGVSTSDWQSTERILISEGLSYELVNSAQLNSMSLDEITSFGAIVVPGGSGGTITGNLTTATRLRVRQAVRDVGVGYAGFCAGAWVAVGPESDTDRVASYGIAVAEGSVLPYWYPPVGAVTSAVVPVSFPDGDVRDLIWYGGPSTPEWNNGVVARYANGKPAISETWSGKGYVVISGPHPEAPQSWRSGAVGTDRDGLDFDIAIEMIRSALTKSPMPVF